MNASAMPGASPDRIRAVTAYAVDGPYPPGYSPQFSTIRFDKVRSVLVKVETEDGLTGWGECASARSNLTIATLVNATLRHLVIGRDATDVAGAWAHVYRAYLHSSGADAAGVIALSGIDMALWDLRGQRCGWPLYRLLGGAAKPLPAYAGGLCMSHKPPEELAQEALGLVEKGYRAIKLRGGDRPQNDLARFTAVRRALGEGFTLMADINTGYTVADLRWAAPRLAPLNLLWLEEPFPPYEREAYRAAAAFTPLALAAGENHFLRYDFQDLLADGWLAYAQPDVSKCGGVTEIMRIAAMASARKIPLCPHASATGLNYATSIHVLSAVDNAGWFEADAAPVNPLHHELCSAPYRLDAEGRVQALEAPGIGVQINLDYLAAHSSTPAL